MAVVAPDGPVHGVDGLPVADASLMPTITRGNINIPTAAMAARVAAAISLSRPRSWRLLAQRLDRPSSAEQGSALGHPVAAAIRLGARASRLGCLSGLDVDDVLSGVRQRIGDGELDDGLGACHANSLLPRVGRDR